MTTTRRGWVLVLILLVGCSCSCSCSVVSGAKKLHKVSIMNRLGEGRSLGVHCRSNNDDLGERTVADWTDYSWTFTSTTNTAVWGPLYMCDIWWGDSNETSHRFNTNFNAVVQGPWDACRGLCQWKVDERGLYRLDPVTRLWWALVHKWDEE